MSEAAQTSTAGRTPSRLDEIEFDQDANDKAVVKSWPRGLRNLQPNMLSEAFADYSAALAAAKTGGA